MSEDKTIPTEQGTLHYNDDKHRYELDGEKLLSCTSVTGRYPKPGLKYWSANCAGEYIEENIEPGQELDEVEISQLAEEASNAHQNVAHEEATVGQKAHEWVESLIRSRIDGSEVPEIPQNERVKSACEGFLRWEEQNDIDWLMHERPVVIPSPHGYVAGTLDIGCLFNGNIMVWDSKAAGGLYANNLIQVAAYRKGLEFTQNIDVDGIGLLRIPKDGGEHETHTETDEEMLERHWQQFVNLHSQYIWQKEIEI